MRKPMRKLVRTGTSTVGLPPGTLLHVGERRTEKIKVTVIDYNEEEFQRREVENVRECYQFRDKPTVTWINIDGLHEVGAIEAIGGCFGLHPMVLEDVLNTHQRPKMEDYGSYVYVVLQMLTWDNEADEPKGEQISIVLGDNYVITFQEKEGDVLGLIRQRLHDNKGRIRKAGADYLAYALIDAIVDHYFIVLENLGNEIETLEDELMGQPGRECLQRIHRLKRDNIFIRRAIWPLRDALSRGQKSGSSLFTEATIPYLGDVHDHAIQIMDTVEAFRDVIAGMHDLYLSHVSNRMNEIMKVLTIIATLFIPITFVAGLYGMNFKFMPELEWRWGYPLALLVMFGLAVGMLAYFRRKKWI